LKSGIRCCVRWQMLPPALGGLRVSRAAGPGPSAPGSMVKINSSCGHPQDKRIIPHLASKWQARDFLEVPQFSQVLPPLPDTPRGISETSMVRVLANASLLRAFNHGQVTPFIMYIAAFGRFMRHSRIQKHFNRHMYSRCMVRSCGALAGAQTLGVQLQTGSGFSLNAK